MSSGPEFTGDKYDQLMAAKPVIEEAGMFVPPTVSIPQGMIDEALNASSLPSVTEANRAVAPDEFQRLQLSPDLMDYLTTRSEKLAAEFNGPLIMRSSARGDAVGTGVYRSEVFSQGAEHLSRAFRIVVSGYYSERAVNFRDRGGIEPGFGTFIQPVVGTLVEAKYRESDVIKDTVFDIFYTPYSGYVKLGTRLWPDGAMRLQQGVGSGVNDSELPVADMVGSTFYFNNPLSAYNGIVSPLLNPRNKVGGPRLSDSAFEFDPTTNSWELGSGVVPVKNIVGDLCYGELREMIYQLNKGLGDGPKYYEFAVRSNDGVDHVYVLQKADLEVRTGANQLEGVEKEKVMVSGLRVEAGNGDSPAFNTIVRLVGPVGKEEIYKFDQEEVRGGYLLVISGSVNSGGDQLDLLRLKNAKAIVVVESSTGTHDKAPAEHLVGWSEKLRVPIMSLYHNSYAQSIEKFDEPDFFDQIDDGYRGLVYWGGDFRVVTESNSREGVIVDNNR